VAYERVTFTYIQIHYIQCTALLITASIPLLLPADKRHASSHKVQTLSRRSDDKLVCTASIFFAENNRSIDSDSALPRSLTSLLVTTAADLMCPFSNVLGTPTLIYRVIQECSTLDQSLLDSGYHNNEIRSYKLRCTCGSRPQDVALRATLELKQPIQVSASDI
jgi:hypothetical protein